MKTKLLLVAVSAFFILPSAFGQGALTPPGAPAPTMKTLAQISAQLDPRTAITNTASAVTISQPGSYYLTGNLTVSSGDAITIATNGVTLDLNGFTISSTLASAAGYGILFSASNPRNLTILNGFIQGGVTNNGSGGYSGNGFNGGILYSAYPPVNVLVSRVSVSGCLTYGIYLSMGDSTVVEGCTARTIGSYGIGASTVKSCGAADCGNTAIQGDQVSDCRGATTVSGYGIFANTALNCYGYTTSNGSGLFANTTAQNCFGYSNGNGYGLSTGTAQNCYGYSSGTGYGLYATYTASGCYGESVTGTGLKAYNASFCTGYRFNGTAIQATIATGCIAFSGTNLITFKYNMP